MSKKRRRKGNRPGPPPPPSTPQTGPRGGPTDAPDTDLSKKERREQALQRRRARERRRRLRYIGIGGLVVAVLAGLFVFQQVQSGQEVAEYVAFSQEAAGCGRVEEVGGLSRDHVTNQAVDYETSPPVGGAHSPSTLRSGLYAEPFSEDPGAGGATVYQAVHSLEHGYVIIWHAPDLDDDARSGLERIVREERKTILVPYPDLEEGEALALTAWGRLQRCSDADPEVVQRFVEVFRERTAPEPDAS